MDSKFEIGNVGFMWKGELIKPHTQLGLLTIKAENKEIEITLKEFEYLLQNKYIVVKETHRPKPKFEVGDFVRVKQISENGVVKYDENYLKYSFLENYEEFSNGIIKSKKFIDSKQKWVYELAGPSSQGVGSESVYAIKVYGNQDETVEESDLEKINELNFIMSVN